ncbi:hypothetical protein HK1_00464 [Tepidibacillus sp. HK-1]|nr:hypothetical protein HK1_00464 [Tepidibacillus sp. HK-1]
MDFSITDQALKQIEALQLPSNIGVRIKAELAAG